MWVFRAQGRRYFFSYSNSCDSQKWSSWLPSPRDPQPIPWPQEQEGCPVTPSLSPCLTSQSPSIAPALFPELCAFWYLNLSTIRMYSLPLTSPSHPPLLYLDRCHTPWTPSDLYQENLCPACLVIPRHSPGLRPGLLLVTGALRLSLPGAAQPAMTPDPESHAPRNAMKKPLCSL